MRGGISVLVAAFILGCTPTPTAPAVSTPVVQAGMLVAPAPMRIDDATIRSMSTADLRRKLVEAHDLLNDQLDAMFSVPARDYAATADVRANIAEQSRVIDRLTTALRQRETSQRPRR